jgi:predicted O-methyltransferase YrrM
MSLSSDAPETVRPINSGTTPDGVEKDSSRGMPLGVNLAGGVVPKPVECYLAGLNRYSTSLMLEVADTGRARQLPLVDPEVGSLLHVLARGMQSTNILEIGTAIGYSGLWLASALPPGGKLVTMEIDSARAAEARRHFARAGLGNRTRVVSGDALQLLETVAGPFDLIFQDGDKRLYSAMLDRLVALLRPGGLLVTDNMLWGGRVVPGFTPASDEPIGTQAIVDYTARLIARNDIVTSIIPLRDGVAISVKLTD